MDCVRHSRLHQRQPQQEARALGTVGSARNEPPCSCTIFAAMERPKPGAAMLGGIKGQKQPLANLIGEPVPVSETKPPPRAVFAERTVNPSTRSRLPCMASAALSIRLARARRIASGSASTVGKSGSRSHFTVMPSAARKQRQRLLGHALFMSQAAAAARETAPARRTDPPAYARCPRSPESLRRICESRWRVRLAAVQVPANALGRKRNGRKRVLDLVRHALRHFLPRQLTLRPQQLRCVFHTSTVPGCPCASSSRALVTAR
jgi:hypothetical protein